MGQITQDEWQIAVRSFDESLSNFYIEPINESIRRAAEQLIQAYAVSYALRTLDAIQLATYQKLTYPTVIMASADERLNVLARNLAHIIWNPNVL